MKNISKKKILVIAGIVVLCIVAIFVMRKLSAKETKVMTLSEQIDKAKTIPETIYSNDGPISTKYINEYLTINMGSYYYDARKNSKKKPISWIVLEKDEANNRALLLSTYILDYDKFSYDTKDLTWAKSNLRDFLNGEFLYSAFSDMERKNIIETPLINSPNPVYNTNAGPNTIDKVFALSLDEVKKYFTGYDDLERGYYHGTYLSTYNTPYANSKTENFHHDYYLRTPGSDNDENALIVKEDNEVYMHLQEASVVYYKTHNVGVRPAIWVKYNSENHKPSGDYLDFTRMHNCVVDSIKSIGNATSEIEDNTLDISGDNDKKELSISMTCKNEITDEELNLLQAGILIIMCKNASDQTLYYKAPKMNYDGIYENFGSLFDNYIVDMNIYNSDGSILVNKVNINNMIANSINMMPLKNLRIEYYPQKMMNGTTLDGKNIYFSDEYDGHEVKKVLFMVYKKHIKIENNRHIKKGE